MNEQDINAIAYRVADILAYKLAPKKAYLSRNEANNEFGRNNVQSWIDKGKLPGHQRASGRVEYARTDLEARAADVQDLAFVKRFLSRQKKRGTL